MNPIQTTCPYCGVGCGVIAERDASGDVLIKGDPTHPANVGRLCSKGAKLADTIGLGGRLLRPEMHGRPVDWNVALDEIARRFTTTIEHYGPDSVAFYVSGQLLTEDYYVANKLMKGFIGSANIDTNSRLCMSSSVAGHKRAFGEDVVPGCYEDLELADLVVLVGSNAAWCHPVLFQRLMAVKAIRPTLKIVSIDPRRTATGELADLHLALQPGTDVILFNGLLHYLRQHERLDFDFIERCVDGCTESLAVAAETAGSIPATAAACGLAEADVANFFRWFGDTEKTVTAWSQGVNQSSSGTDKVNAIINVHLATGRIGRPGMGPLSLTGQPNAMGGREVGGLANQLAAHLELDVPSHRDAVQQFWRSPRIADKPGLKAVDLFDAVGRQEIKALWIIATNPAVSLPDAGAVRRGLVGLEFLVVSDCEDETDLKPYAHVRLPALAWGEKNGTVTNSERRISRQRAFLPEPGEAKADWWAVTEIARRMGFGEAFGYQQPAEIFREHAALSAIAAKIGRCFSIGALTADDDQAYAQMMPTQWPIVAEGQERRLFADGHFPTPNNRAQMLALQATSPAHPPDSQFPFVLNTGRIRDQWHTMTRTARSAALNRHLPEPFVEMHPDDASRLGIADGTLVRLRSCHGEALGRARMDVGQRPGNLFMPMHWGKRYARSALANDLVNPVVDPISGEPESKHTPVTVEVWPASWHAFVLSRERLRFDASIEWCVEIPQGTHLRYEVAGCGNPLDTALCRRLFMEPYDPDAGEWLEFADRTAGRYRCALLKKGRLMACVFVDRHGDLPPRDWLAGLFDADKLPASDRAALLAAKPAHGTDGGGRIVCVCHGVGYERIVRSIREEGSRSTTELAERLKAGTGCGSCVGELKAIIAEQTRAVA